ncbi:MAG TPA: orotate phosphoribosyltransferase [Hyphomicrobiaceae bacterium]|nr:orotate phosphoribosyltransferase [Hyphomicrobiaceae bacterium]
MTSTDTSRARLIAIIKRRSFSTGAEIKLVSGRSSSFYFDMKPTMLDPEGAYLIGELVLEVLNDAEIDLVGGLEMGAVPLATTVAAASFAKGRPLPAFFVRKQAKEHGARKLVEGLAPGETLAGKRIAVLEDVTTTGGSASKAIETLKAEGAIIDRIVTVVDRLEGAAETFKKAGFSFTPILTADNFR